jgi:TRAP-type mannitol/chloroaromatic compound transport system permease large subunit
VFGIPLGVSTAFVFLFVLFGSLLDKAGAGNYFIQLAFAGLGHLRGGPAKAAVVGSAMTGLISGSSIANVVTTGTFTIPLMKRVGFSSEKAGAVEVASSVNGQIMPPVMGAAAFLMVEFVGISYLEVIKHAFIPAVISYIALVYIVHLEALKRDMPALGEAKSLAQMFLKIFIGFVVAGAGFYRGNLRRQRAARDRAGDRRSRGPRRDHRGLCRDGRISAKRDDLELGRSRVQGNPPAGSRRCFRPGYISCCRSSCSSGS